MRIKHIECIVPKWRFKSFARDRIMIPHSQPFSTSVLTGVNPCLQTFRPDSRLLPSPSPEPQLCLSCPSCPNLPCVPPSFLPLEVFSVFSVSALARGAVAATQLRKTNPISKNPKPPQHSFLQRLTTVFHSAPPRKTNPNKPNRNQSPRRKIGEPANFLHQPAELLNSSVASSGYLMYNGLSESRGFQQPHSKLLASKDLQ